jgi:hypothetical protein
VTANYTLLDGSTQSRHTGETNGGGPELMIDGSLAGPANGLQFSGWDTRVTRLAIGNFDGNGIESNLNGRIEVQYAYVGLHPSGLRGAPNAGRGIQSNRGGTVISYSYLAANGRSGAYINGSTSSVGYNFIGVGTDGVTPIGNGASGLFFQKSGGQWWERHDAFDNVIANNGQAGIGFNLNVIGDFGRNTFRNNGGRAIDAGMDGTSLETRGYRPGDGGVIGAPVIASAEYMNGLTTIIGYAAQRMELVSITDVIHVYANREGKDGGELIGSVTPRPGGVPLAGWFTLEVPRDLRGWYVSASSSIYYVFNFDDPAPGTSEAGVPRLVQ